MDSSVPIGPIRLWKESDLIIIETSSVKKLGYLDGPVIPATGAYSDCSAEATVKALLAFLAIFPDPRIWRLLGEACLEGNDRLVPANLRLYVARNWTRFGKKLDIKNFQAKMDNLVDINEFLDDGSDIFFIATAILFKLQIHVVQVDFTKKIMSITKYLSNKNDWPTLVIVNDFASNTGRGTHFSGFIPTGFVTKLTSSFGERLFREPTEFMKDGQLVEMEDGSGFYRDWVFDSDSWQRNLFWLYKALTPAEKTK